MDRQVSPTSGGHKVAQIANRFQGSNSNSSNNSSGDDATPKRQPPPHPPAPALDNASSPLLSSGSSPKEAVSTPVVRTESHAARFNNARALFEKLGVESRLVSRPVAAAAAAAGLINGKMSKDTVTMGEVSSPDKMMTNGGGSVAPLLRNGSTSTATNGNGRMAVDSNVSGTSPAVNVAPVVVPGKIFNVSRPKPEKPEKPERKFNSRELIEKQKNWTSHFSKARTSPKFNSDPNRCDIIRTVPGTGLHTKPPAINNNNNNNNSDTVQVPVVSPKVQVQVVSSTPPAVPHRQHVSQSFDSAVSHNNNNIISRKDDDDDIPPCPPIRQNSIPEIKPRSINNNKPPVIVGAVAANGNNSSPVKIMVKRSPEASPEKMKGEYNNNNSWTGGDDQQTHLGMMARKDEDVPEKIRKKSFDLIEENNSAGLGRSRSQSLEKENVISPGIGLSSSSSPMASISSEPTSPIHTEDEKQENEANEKTDLGLMTPTDGIDKSEGTDSGEWGMVLMWILIAGGMNNGRGSKKGELYSG